MTYPFYTIGHGTRPIGEFVGLLQAAAVTLVADVRTVPRSRTNPHYNRDVLPQILAQSHVAYRHIAGLGGLRDKNRDVASHINAFWRNTNFHNYADYAMGASFRSGLAELEELGRYQCCAIMCAEILSWRCHRRIIADYLIAAGRTVFHILRRGHIEPAYLTAAVQRHPSGMLTYPVSS